MARKKTPATRVNVKAQVSSRLRELRVETFGEHGGPEMARRLNLPARTWYNYETGVTVPAEVLLGFIDQTGANPIWLLSGRGPRFRRDGETRALEDLSPQELIRRGLEKLEEERRDRDLGVADTVAIDVVPMERLGDAPPGDVAALGQVLADRMWIPNPSATIAARLDDDAMDPILPAGSVVAVDRSVREPQGVINRIAAARVEGRPVVRWAERSGKHLVLRANGDPAAFPLMPIEAHDGKPSAILGLVVWSWSRFERG